MTDPRPTWGARWFIQLVLTYIMAAMAVQLWLPGDTFGAGQSGGAVAGNWRLVSIYMTEKTAASLMWAVACVGALGMATASRWVKLASVIVLCLAHALLMGAFLWSNPSGVGMILLSGYAAFGLYLTYRRFAEGVR